MGRRIAAPSDLSDRVAGMLLAAERAAAKVTDCDTLADVVYPYLAGAAEERLVCVAFTRSLRVIEARVLTVGSDQLTVVDPRQILRFALTCGRSPAAAIALAHNHPSGDATPSGQDREVTRRVASACKVVGVRLLDHLVVADGPSGRVVRSLASDGDLPVWSEEPTLRVIS